MRIHHSQEEYRDDIDDMHMVLAEPDIIATLDTPIPPNDTRNSQLEEDEYELPTIDDMLRAEADTMSSTQLPVPASGGWCEEARSAEGC